MLKVWTADDLIKMDDATLNRFQSNTQSIIDRDLSNREKRTRSELIKTATELLPMIEREISRRTDIRASLNAYRSRVIKTEKSGSSRIYKSKMTISALYRELGATPRNTRWSWGAINPITKVVFLSVWTDGIKDIEERKFVQVTGPHNIKRNPGFRERLTHVDAIQSGQRGFLIFCRPKNIQDHRRSVSTINADQLFPVIGSMEIDGNLYFEFDAPIRRSEFDVSK